MLGPAVSPDGSWARYLPLLAGPDPRWKQKAANLNLSVAPFPLAHLGHLLMPTSPGHLFWGCS
jgi:hypothetical protein